MKIIQILLIFILLLVSFLFYKNYIKKIETDLNDEDPFLLEPSTLKNEAGKIKNLSYEINLPNGKLYKISAITSEVIKENDVELLNMFDVLAFFLDEKKERLTIEADSAIYNALNYNTIFKDGVIVKYLDKIIISNNMELDFQKNILIFYGNVKFRDQKYEMHSDKVSIDLITSDIDISMMDINENIKFKNIN